MVQYKDQLWAFETNAMDQGLRFFPSLSGLLASQEGLIFHWVNFVLLFAFLLSRVNPPPLTGGSFGEEKSLRDVFWLLGFRETWGKSRLQKLEVTILKITSNSLGTQNRTDNLRIIYRVFNTFAFIVRAAKTYGSPSFRSHFKPLLREYGAT